MTAPPAGPVDADVFELSTLLAGDALDVTPSRLRDARAKVVPLWRAAGLTLEEAMARLPPP